MILDYLNILAHQGVDHTTSAEAAKHADSNPQLALTIAISSVILVAILVTAKLMSAASQPPPAPAGKEKKK